MPQWMNRPSRASSHQAARACESPSLLDKSCCKPSIDHVCSARDERGFVAHEEHDEARNLGWLRDPSDRMHGGELCEDCFDVALRGGVLPQHGCVDRPGADAVDPDAIVCTVECHGPRERY